MQLWCSWQQMPHDIYQKLNFQRFLCLDNKIGIVYCCQKDPNLFFTRDGNQYH